MYALQAPDSLLFGCFNQVYQHSWASLERYHQSENSFTLSNIQYLSSQCYLCVIFMMHVLGSWIVAGLLHPKIWFKTNTVWHFKKLFFKAIWQLYVWKRAKIMNHYCSIVPFSWKRAVCTFFKFSPFVFHGRKSERHKGEYMITEFPFFGWTNLLIHNPNKTLHIQIK